MEKEKERAHFFREDGGKVYIQSISILELQKVEENIRKEYKDRGEPIEPPKYKVTTAGGGQIELQMDETNLEVEGNPEETAKRKLDWQIHQDALNRMKAEIGAISTEILMEGVICDPPTEEWINKRKRRHLLVPEDPDELMQFYKMIEILRTPGDIVKAQGEILILSSSGAVKREDVEAAGATFLGEIQFGQKREILDVRRNGRKTAQKPMGTQSDTKRIRRRKRVGSITEPVENVQPE